MPCNLFRFILYLKFDELIYFLTKKKTFTITSTANNQNTAFVIRDCASSSFCRTQNLTSTNLISLNPTFNSELLNSGTGVNVFSNVMCNQCATDNCNNEQIFANDSSSIKISSGLLILNVLFAFFFI